MASKKAQRHIIASIGTILFMLMVMLVLLFVYLRSQKPEIEEGVELTFGDVGEMIQEVPMASSSAASSAASSEPVVTPQPVTPSSQPSADPILSDEETLAMQREKAKQDSIAAAEQQRRAKELAEQKERERKAEEARKEAERKAAEEKAKQEQEIANAQGMAGLFQKNGNGTGNGTGNGDSHDSGPKGNPAGHGSVGGNDWILAGRDIKTFPVPEKGKYAPGKVVIEIRVNPQGQVVSARETVGGNIGDRATVEAMLKKAREVQFSASDSKTDQIGYITYNIPD